MILPSSPTYFGKRDNKQQLFSLMDFIISIASAYAISCNKQYSGFPLLVRFALSSAKKSSSVMRRELILIPLRKKSR